MNQNLERRDKIINNCRLNDCISGKCKGNNWKLTRINEFNKVTMYKVNITSVALIYTTNNETLNLSDSNSIMQILENDEEISSLLGE